jgi:hypothetical protein
VSCTVVSTWLVICQPNKESEYVVRRVFWPVLGSVTVLAGFFVRDLARVYGIASEAIEERMLDNDFRAGQLPSPADPPAVIRRTA